MQHDANALAMSACSHKSTINVIQAINNHKPGYTRKSALRGVLPDATIGTRGYSTIYKGSSGLAIPGRLACIAVKSIVKNVADIDVNGF